MKEINGYRLLSDFSADNSGFSQWAFAEKDGFELFIKKFLSPVYPVESSLFDEEEQCRRRAYCEEFVAKKKALYLALQRCRNDSIVPVLDFFRQGSKYYIVTEKINDAKISSEEIFQLDFDEKLPLMRELCGSIDELHKEGVIHADLKPGNLLFEKNPSGGLAVKIIDFDSSFLRGSHVYSEAIEGDPVYLAPETYLAMQGSAVQLSDKMDIFALGVIFHQYLLGTLPEFNLSARNYVFESVLADAKLIFPSETDPLIQKMLRGMLHKDPRKRWELKKAASYIDKINKSMMKKKLK